MKNNMGSKYQQMKADILAQNKSDYKRIREQRQNCLEEKYAIIENKTQRCQSKFQEQKYNELRLKEMLTTQRATRMQSNKSRYDD